MLTNHIKRETALNRAQSLQEQSYFKNKANLKKWEDYRDKKIDLTAKFIKVLKRKNFTRRWLIS